MDASRFDNLIRSFTSRSSRCGVLFGLASGLITIGSLTINIEETEGEKKQGKGTKKGGILSPPDSQSSPSLLPLPGPTCGDGIRNGTETDVD